MIYDIKYRKEEEMKDSGIEWLGKVPKDWGVTRVKYISNIFGRIGFRGYTTEDIVDEGEGAITLSPSNIENQQLSLSNKTYISWEKYNESPEIKIYNEDVLLVKTASIGKVAYIENLFEPATINPQFVVFKNIKSNKKLFYYNFISVLMQEQVKYVSNGGVISTLTQKDIGDFHITNIDELNQQKIANFLDLKTSEFDSIIAKKELLIEKLEEAKKSLISEVVTGKVKIVDGEIVKREAEEMKDSGVEWLGMIPKDWEVKRLKFLANLKSDKIIPETDTIYIGLENIESITGKYLESSNKEFIAEGISNKFSKNNVLFGKLRPYLAKCIIADFDGVCSSELLVLEPEKMMPILLKYYMLNDHFIKLVNSSTYGVKMPRASWDFIGNIDLPYSNLMEQNSIIEFLDNEINNINLIMTKTKLQIQKLKLAKQSLISEAVTGKIDLSDWEII